MSTATTTAWAPVAMSVIGCRTESRQPQAARWGTTDVFAPGDSRDITFVAGRGREFREPPGGNTFDLSATFEAIGSGAGGQLRVLRTYPVAFQGVPRS